MSLLAFKFFSDEAVIRFGDFTLKSGKKSPYFFNTGLLCSARQLAHLGALYAEKIRSIPEFSNADVIFGSAYKGIPISVATAIAMAQTHPDLRAVSDRKEAKTHGDAGGFLGVLNAGDRVVIVDDVITDGGTKLEAIAKLREAGCDPLGFVIAFDRCEVAGEGKTSRELFEEKTGLPVYPLLTVHDVIKYADEEISGKLTTYLQGV